MIESSFQVAWNHHWKRLSGTWQTYPSNFGVWTERLGSCLRPKCRQAANNVGDRPEQPVNRA
eukprot:2448686-Amphidinium_carterae.1